MKKHLKIIQVISVCMLFCCLLTGCDYAEKISDVGEHIGTIVEKVGQKVQRITASKSIGSENDNKFSSDNEIMDNTAMEIVTALEEEDVETIKSLFSQEALGNADDIDEQIQEAIDFYEGTMENYIPAHQTSRRKHDGITTIEYVGYYTIETDKETYELRLAIVEKSDENPDMEGMMTIEIVYREDMVGDFKWQANWKEGDYGVYIQR